MEFQGDLITAQVVQRTTRGAHNAQRAVAKNKREAFAQQESVLSSGRSHLGSVPNDAQ